MSKQTDNGGAAFPCMDKHYPNGNIEYGSLGMTLRDYFAAAALQGNLASQSIECGYYQGEDCWEKAARDAYKAADAMLAARKEGNQP
jgi:hypothetical protein